MKKFFYTFAFILCALMTLQAETMVVATYNLRNANGGDSTNGNGWGQRYPYIAQIVQFHGFDIFGTQEGKYPQLLVFYGKNVKKGFKIPESTMVYDIAGTMAYLLDVPQPQVWIARPILSAFEDN